MQRNIGGARRVDRSRGPESVWVAGGPGGIGPCPKTGGYDLGASAQLGDARAGRSTAVSGLAGISNYLEVFAQ